MTSTDDRRSIAAEPLGEGDGDATPWEEARRRLAEPDYYWLTTTRPDGGPHVRPLLAVLLGDSLYFCTGTDTRKRGNLAADPRCSLAAETDEFHLVVEAEATRVGEDAALRDVADAYAEKYGWQVDVRDGAFHADGAPTAGPPPYEVYEATPRTAFGFGLVESSVSTRWRFDGRGTRKD